MFAKHPQEIWKLISEHVDGAEDWCQLAMVSRIFYKFSNRDFKRLCFNNLIYRLRDEMWPEALSQAPNRVWTEFDAWPPRKIMFYRKSGSIAFGVGNVVVITSLDFSKNYFRLIELEDIPLYFAFANCGKYLTVTYKQNAPIHIHSVSTGQLIMSTKEKLSHRYNYMGPCRRNSSVVGIIYKPNSIHGFFNPNTLQTHFLLDPAFHYHPGFQVFDSEEHDYMIARDRYFRGQVQVLDMVRGKVYRLPGTDSRNKFYSVLTDTGMVLMFDETRTDLYDLKTERVVGSYEPGAPWNFLNARAVVSPAGKIRMVDKTGNLRDCPITLDELLRRNDVQYEWDLIGSGILEEVIFINEIDPITKATRPESRRVVFVDIRKDSPKFLFYEARRSSQPHLLFTMLNDLTEKEVPITDLLETINTNPN